MSAPPTRPKKTPAETGFPAMDKLAQEIDIAIEGNAPVTFTAKAAETVTIVLSTGAYRRDSTHVGQKLTLSGARVGRKGELILQFTDTKFVPWVRRSVVCVEISRSGWGAVFEGGDDLISETITEMLGCTMGEFLDTAELPRPIYPEAPEAPGASRSAPTKAVTKRSAAPAEADMYPERGTW